MGRWQLQEIGLTERMIRTRVAHGGLHRLHRGVYAVGHRALSWRGRWLAAVWLGFHVYVSLHHDAIELVVHSLLFVALTCFLFRAPATAYFHPDVPAASTAPTDRK